MAKKEPTYDEPQIGERLRELPGWYFEDGWIRRVYKTDGWPTTLMLVNAIGYLSEAAYHHPDLSVIWLKRPGTIPTSPRPMPLSRSSWSIMRPRA